MTLAPAFPNAEARGGASRRARGELRGGLNPVAQQGERGLVPVLRPRPARVLESAAPARRPSNRSGATTSLCGPAEKLVQGRRRGGWADSYWLLLRRHFGRRFFMPPRRQAALCAGLAAVTSAPSLAGGGCICMCCTGNHPRHVPRNECLCNTLLCFAE